MRTALVSAFCLLACGGVLRAGSRASADYSLSAETLDAGGVSTAQSANGVYTLAGSALGEPGAGTSNAPVGASNDYALKTGFVGTLYNVVALAVAANPTSVNEGGATTQLSAAPLLDDNTRLAPLAAGAVAWTVASGPVAAVSTTGVATAANVYQNTTAIVRASYQGFTGTGSFTVLNVGTDDFGSYAGDGIDDAWQVQYFGVNNPQAGPLADADGTGQNNLFKYLAGLNPLDPTSRFVVLAQPSQSQGGAVDVVFGPLLPAGSGRVYTVQYSGDLATWTTLTGATQTDNGTTRTVTDPNAAANGRRFYRVLVTKP